MYARRAVLRPALLAGFLAAPGLASAAKDVSLLANSDPVYKQLRGAPVTESFVVENRRLERDVGVLLLRRGTVSFAPAVQGRVTLGVFVGQGEFRLTPPTALGKRYMQSILDKDEAVEPIRSAVLVFTDDTYQEIRAGRQPGAPDAQAADVLRDVRQRLRRSLESPRSQSEALLASGDVENIEAEVLAALYNPQRPAFFVAYLQGQRFGDLRFFLRPSGALPGMMALEEVALVNLTSGSDEDGVWYLGHLRGEIAAKTAGSSEEKRTIQVEAYRIDTTIGDDMRLAATCGISFRAIAPGERVLRFDLLPTLRVSKVTLGGREIPFIQEARQDDAAFYVILSEAPAKGSTAEVTVEYEGDRVITRAGGGNFYVGARTSWHPNANSFRDRARFQLTFRYPSRYTLVSVGRRTVESRKGDQMVAEWASDVPLAVAGFNYGRFKLKEVRDAALNFQIQGFATTEAPDYLRSPELDLPKGLNASHIAEGASVITPTLLLDRSIAQAQVSQRLFTRYFGVSPYGRLAITQQPDFNFGQSWPTLVYLPLSAFLDSTQRWKLLGRISDRLTAFVEEVTAHEVAHQWWGHLVGWNTFHDQWLSEGLATFSAGLYLQVTEPKTDRHLKYWEQARERILEKNEYGRRPNDAGPLWLGVLADTPRNRAARALIYEKAGYVVHMLRWLMFDPKTGDQAFIAMMHDLVKTYLHRCITTEQFQALVEKHMLPVMDVDGNGSMNWFFSQWVHGTDVPRYQLDYKITPQGDKWLLKASLSQSEVGPDFVMQVPLYAEFDGQFARLARVRMAGSSTLDNITVTLPRKPRRVLVNANFDVLSQK